MLTRQCAWELAQRIQQEVVLEEDVQALEELLQENMQENENAQDNNVQLSSPARDNISPLVEILEDGYDPLQVNVNVDPLLNSTSRES
jgi:hypothetical protein